jgi:hypothetical protein
MEQDPNDRGNGFPLFLATALEALQGLADEDRWREAKANPRVELRRIGISVPPDADVILEEELVEPSSGQVGLSRRRTLTLLMTEGDFDGLRGISLFMDARSGWGGDPFPCQGGDPHDPSADKARRRRRVKPPPPNPMSPTIFAAMLARRKLEGLVAPAEGRLLRPMAELRHPEQQSVRRKRSPRDGG